MQWKAPKNSKKYYWTEHVKQKMQQYQLSGQRITRIIKSPYRIEQCVAGKNIVAAMQPQSCKRDKKTGKKTWNAEIWVMYKMKVHQLHNKKTQFINQGMQNFLQEQSLQEKQFYIISAWRYPGKTPKGEPIPEELIDEISNTI